MIQLKQNPFFLDDKAINWVETTLAGMSLEEKVGQLFCPIGMRADDAYLSHLICDLKIGGMMYRPGGKDEIRQVHTRIQELSNTPLLLAANLESGGNGIIKEGSTFGKPMAVAATGDVENAYHMAKAACQEGAAVGLNWAFAPIVDIDYEYKSPITNVRTFGSDMDTIISCAQAYLRAADEEDVAVSIKHFPGDGTDERDQHLVTSINRQSADEWRKTFGKIYQTLIDQGAKTVMVGHIAQPKLVEEICPNATSKEKVMPATLSPALLNNVLRKELQFNGLIVTDATLMIGFASAMPRNIAVPTAIAAGCDMFLFNKNLDEDYQFMMQGIADGLLTLQRVDEAVTRILATKASLKLHLKKEAGTLLPDRSAMDCIGCDEFIKWQEKNADESITLVRDTQKLLPLSPTKTPKMYLNVIQHSDDPNEPKAVAMKTLFEQEGFTVTMRNRSTKLTPKDLGEGNLSLDQQKFLQEMQSNVADFKAKYDIYVYVANVETASNNTVIRLDWNVLFGSGDDAPWFTEELPVLFISTQNPYHLFDAPMMKTYINAYDNNEFSRKALMDKLMGRSDFKGMSPVDPYCGDPYIEMAGACE